MKTMLPSAGDDETPERTEVISDLIHDYEWLNFSKQQMLAAWKVTECILSFLQLNSQRRELYTALLYRDKIIQEILANISREKRGKLWKVWVR